MKTVAVSTVGKYYLLANYGSFFQHYALRIVLKRLGFVPFRVVDKDEVSSFWAMCCEQIMDWLRPIYWRIKRLPNRDVEVRRLKIRKKLYWKFIKDYSALIGDFNEDPRYNDSTVGVRGGDQVLYPRAAEQWFSRVPIGNARITYAASTDWCHNRDDSRWRKGIRDCVRNFTALGLRESVGVGIVKELVPEGVPVQHVADPVQLLTLKDFRDIQCKKRVFHRPTVFCYFVNIRSEEDLRLAEYERLAKLLGCDLKIAGVQGAELFIPSKYRVLYSPRQFLRALDDAKCFITNSYHGTVLAIQYQKLFLSVWQNCPVGTNQNERQKELVEKFGIENRWVDYKCSAEDWKRALELPVDWQKIDASVGEWRKFSLDWLSKVIEE